MFADIPWLSPDHYEFPPVANALKDPNGLLAMGGDLSADRLINAYRSGIFPWYSENQPILWWSPDPRTVLYPKEFKLSRSLKKSIKNKEFKVTFDLCFNEVMIQCAQPRVHELSTWITQAMIKAYVRLHELGFSHSIEVWREKQLVGGLYGVSMGKVFCGESMFSKQSDASKVALAALTQQALTQGIDLIDCQMPTKHLLSLGARTISRTQYLRHLQQGLTQSVSWPCGDFSLNV